MANHYHLIERNVNSTAVTGNHLAYGHKSLAVRAFLAADLVLGARHLAKPTIVQSAALANVNRTYAWWAVKRQAERTAIEAGLIPLVPPRVKPAPTPIIDDMELVAIARAVGVDRMINAAAMVEAAQ
jgi:hypothetical protein